MKKFFDILPRTVSSSFEAGENIDLRTLEEAVESPPTEESSMEEPLISRSEVEPQTEIKPPETRPTEPEHEDESLKDLVEDIMDVAPKDLAQEQLTSLMDHIEDPQVILAGLGAKFHNKLPKSDLPVFTFDNEVQTSKQPDDEFHRKVLQMIREPVAPRAAVSLASSVSKPPVFRAELPQIVVPDRIPIPQPQAPKRRSIIADDVISFYNKTSGPTSVKKAVLVMNKPKPVNFIGPPKKRRTGWWLALIVLIGLVAYLFALKSEVMQGGASAFNNLQSAGESLKGFKFSEASDNFGKSYQDFSRAGQTMNFMGAGLAGIFSDLPGVGKLKSAKDMVEAGKLIAKSGQAMSDALKTLSQTGAILNPADKNKIKPLKIITALNDALVLSNKNFQKAKALIADIDESVIPEDKRASFHDFKDKIPLLEKYLDNSIEYTEFLRGIVGIDEPKKYLLLFNNSSELRPTGGFPGTYGVVSFSSGGLSDFFVNDVYNLDGQLKRNVIPPKQLQHITPNWGMRDASWFFDFPTSAKKAMSFFTEEAGYRVDGVIALNPDIVSGILAVVGPITLPDYNITLTADNFVETIQREVEYGKNRTQPKSVVVDFAPRFLEKLYSADSEKWMKIFNVLMSGLEEKDILFYFEDKEAEDFSVKEGFGGEVKRTDGDYLAVNFSNVKGSKTDAVTDSSIAVDTRFEGGQAIHKVTLLRNHRGGDKEHGFYNRQNPVYVRVLVPEDAELMNISGNDNPNYKPIINYGIQGGFEKDRDLAIYESTFYADNPPAGRAGFTGVDKFEETGKKGIGFWMITDPGTTKKIEFEYSVPITDNQDTITKATNYDFYFQKQPGLDWKNFVFKINDSKNNIAGTTPVLSRIGDAYISDELLKKDFDIKVKFK